MTTITRTETFEILHCASCGIAFGITRDFEQRRRGDLKSFFCPAGHSQWFPAAALPGETGADRAQRLNTRAQQAEAVAWQCRARLGEGSEWMEWQECEKEDFDSQRPLEIFQGRPLETQFRELFTHPLPQGDGESLSTIRYAWLRGHFRFANDSMHELWFDRSIADGDDGYQLDQAIDAAMGGSGEKG